MITDVEKRAMFKQGLAQTLAEAGLLPSEFEAMLKTADKKPVTEFWKQKMDELATAKEKPGKAVKTKAPKAPDTVKLAFELPGEKVVSTAMKPVADTAGTIMGDAYGAARNVAVGAPFLGPAGASYYLHSMDRTQPSDIEAMQNADLIMSLRRASAEIRRRQAERKRLNAPAVH